MSKPDNGELYRLVYDIVYRHSQDECSVECELSVARLASTLCYTICQKFDVVERGTPADTAPEEDKE